MFCALDAITDVCEDADGVSIAVLTHTGIQRWRYRTDGATVVAHTEKLSAVLAVAAPARLDRQWVLEFLLDRGVDAAGLIPAGLIAELDLCAQCGDALSWCSFWLKRWPRLGDMRGIG